MKKFFLFLLCLSLFSGLHSQINAKLMRYMDVSDTKICFVYGGDIWIMSRDGGPAVQVTHSPGEESWPRFSPDGSSIAYTASYNGNEDIYVIPSLGGVATRITYQSHSDRMLEWYPDGENILFASGRESGRQSIKQFYMVSKSGGLPVKLKVPYGELASFSPDGNSLAYITKITENYPFKRYRGGLASDILIYDMKNNTAENITNNHANDGKPAWVGDKVYFLSDQAVNMRLNIWVYDMKSKESKQITNSSDFDISYLSAGKKELVFEAGGVLYLMDVITEKYEQVQVNVVSDLSVEMPRMVNVSKRINNMSASPGGKRVVFEARGEIFNVPSKEGFVVNITQSSGAFDRDPAWAPNGEQIAFWSDRSGEFEIYLQPSDGLSPARKITKRGKGYGYTLYWSPNSKMLSFIDETNTIHILDVKSGDISIAGNTHWNTGHGGRSYFHISWAPDSKWMAFTQGMENANNAIYLYSLAEGKSYQVTSGFYEDYYPVFSMDGKYLFYLTDRNFSATYSDLGDGTWVYPNSTRVASLSLSPENPSLLKPENDVVGVQKKPKADSSKVPDVKIDFINMESRLVILPPKAGNIGSIFSFRNKLVYLRQSNTGSGERSASLIYYDFKKREEKTIISNVSRVSATANGKLLLVASKGKYGIIKPMPKQKIEKPIPTSGLEMNLIPREEWQQIFLDTWRRYRDFFMIQECTSSIGRLCASVMVN